MLNQINQSNYYLANDDARERPALGLVCGDKYSLVIDAGNSAQHAREFLLEVRALNVPPVKYVVITHGHWDHFLGMNEFEDASIIVNSLTNETIKQWQRYSFDDESLQRYKDSSLITDQCVEVIVDEIPERESFKLVSPDIIFQNQFTIDLGNKVCLLETIKETHTDDSTIVYVPDDKVIYLGDCAYGTTTNSLFHYKQSHLLPMIESITKYEANDSLLGHESICDQNEMNVYWNELTSTSRVVDSTSMEEALDSFKKEYRREPNFNEAFFLQAFVNDRKIHSNHN
ncbi:MBL fold metallo-hydrolase [Geomicrobium sediminis]|uniref:Glyoxylase-like metal-dependent hydrolase (Beta-lactamase superfamily II) n=1 Tax=Geomicrobium sediminis TaxID=1347788 RepID=A0ABS2PAC0_9BACL|nr:MBL fold metallo-hydrolase [Geomicrobium sediminis]MBM7632345.1 glyoxylase-like metal-dependent hydrolase (beta-lactamase superfamily II) [Geomicrobium sediminis]